MRYIDSIESLLKFMEDMRKPLPSDKEKLTVPEKKAGYRNNLRNMMNKGKKW